MSTGRYFTTLEQRQIAYREANASRSPNCAHQPPTKNQERGTKPHLNRPRPASRRRNAGLKTTKRPQNPPPGPNPASRRLSPGLTTTTHARAPSSDKKCATKNESHSTPTASGWASALRVRAPPSLNPNLNLNLDPHAHAPPRVSTPPASPNCVHQRATTNQEPRTPQSAFFNLQ